MRLLTGQWLLAVGLIILPTFTSAKAEEPAVHQSTADVKKALTDVIDSQLAAFRSGDYAKAYSFAASGFQAQYSTGDLEGMVKTAYPIIARSTSVDYGAALDTGDEAIIDAHIVSTTEKRDAQYRYRLQKEDGKWRINGVVELKPTGLSV